MKTKIIGAVKNLNTKNLEILKNAKLYDLEDHHLSFYSGEELIYWHFKDSLKTMKKFLEKNEIKYRDLTSEEDINMCFEEFFDSIQRERLEKSNGVMLFWNDIMYSYEGKSCFYAFPENEINRIRTYLIRNKVNFKDLT